MYLNIRGKLALGLSLVLVVSLILFGGAVTGLVSYRRTITKFDLAVNDAPHPSDLVKAVSELTIPLIDEVSTAGHGGTQPGQIDEHRKARFLEQLDETEQQIVQFHRRIDHFNDRNVGLRITQMLEPPVEKIELGLRYLRPLADGIDSADQERRVETLREIRLAMSKMLQSAVNVEDVTLEMNRELVDAKSMHKSLSYVIGISGGSSLVIFLLLIRYGYVSFFVPVRKLYEGARRVTLEDFSYRVQINSEDEMGEFAAAFNSMIDRFQDIKEDLDKQVQERSQQLVRSERLAGVGFLAAGVAHEINNPLSAIVMAADSLEDRLDTIAPHLDKSDKEIFQSYLKMIQRESDRCRSITGRLLDFARGQDGMKTRVDIASVIREVLEMISHLGKFKGRNIVFDYPQPCYLTVNGAEIKQVMLNLTANSLEAMSDGGTLTITIREFTERVEISFQDDGCGMTREVIDNLFEPFFTQKADGQAKGTGLGMSISNRIIDDHQGTITPHSDGPGKGSTFVVKLPRKASQQSAA